MITMIIVWCLLSGVVGFVAARAIREGTKPADGAKRDI